MRRELAAGSTRDISAVTICVHQTAAETFCVCCFDSRRLCYQAQWSVTEMKKRGDSEGKEEQRGGITAGGN